MIVCLCPNTVSCLGVEVEFTHAREWPASVAMGGLSPWIQAMRRGFWVQRVTFCLLPFLYLVSLYQAVHLFRPHVSLFLSSGRLMAQYIHYECGWLVREQNQLSSVPRTPTWKMLL